MSIPKNIMRGNTESGKKFVPNTCWNGPNVAIKKRRVSSPAIPMSTKVLEKKCLEKTVVLFVLHAKTLKTCVMTTVPKNPVTALANAALVTRSGSPHVHP